MHVLVDDIRDEGADVIIRHPEKAIEVLRRLDGVIETLSMDNDMGLGIEGKHVLDEALQVLIFPPRKVIIVTSNPVAAQHMRQTLEHHSYSSVDRFVYTRKVS